MSTLYEFTSLIIKGFYFSLSIIAVLTNCVLPVPESPFIQSVFSTFKALSNALRKSLGL